MRTLKRAGACGVGVMSVAVLRTCLKNEGEWTNDDGPK